MRLMTYDESRASVQEFVSLRALIEGMALGHLLLPLLDALVAEFGAAPEPEAGAPSLRELRDAHMEGAAELGAVLDAYRFNPLATEEVRAAAQRIHDAVVEGHKGNGISAARRWQIALKVSHAVRGLEADLALLPEAVGERIQAWVEVGLAIREALGQVAPRRSVELRNRTRNFISRLRGAVRTEVGMNPALPDDLEQQLLGFVDTYLVESNGRGGARAEEAEVEPPVEDAEVVPEAMVEVEAEPVEAEPVEAEPDGPADAELACAAPEESCAPEPVEAEVESA